MTRNWRIALALAIGASLPLITWIVYLDPQTMGSMMHFYYIPIVFAAVFLGDIAGIITAIAVALISIAPQVLLRTAPAEYWVPPTLRTCFFYAVAVLAARLAAQFHLRAQELSSLLSVSRAVNASHGLHEVFQTIVDKAVDLMGAKAAAVWLLAPDQRELIFEAGRGLTADHPDEPSLSVGDGAAASDYITGRTPTLVRDTTHWPASEWRTYAEREGIRSLACVPVTMRSRPLGLLCIYVAERSRFGRRQIRLLEAFADHAAVAIENARLYDNVRNNYWHTVRALTRAIEAKDPQTLGHSERVTQYALRMAQELHLTPDDIEILRFGSILHDIGRIGVTEPAFIPAGGLSASDTMLARLHPLIGKSILEPVSFLDPAAQIVLYHHENFDGSGYPEGLAGAQIPRFARLVAVANAYDDLTADRAERSPLPRELALERIEAQSGALYDPDMVRALAAALRREE